MISEELKRKDKDACEQYPLGTEIEIIESGAWGKISGYHTEEKFSYEKRTEPVLIIEPYGGGAILRKISGIGLWREKKEKSGLLGWILCLMSFHKYEKNPARRGLLKNTGWDILFSTSVVQKAKRSCLRGGCDHAQKVYRSGFVGLGGSSGEWEKLDERKEKEIDELFFL